MTEPVFLGDRIIEVDGLLVERQGEDRVIATIRKAAEETIQYLRDAHKSSFPAVRIGIVFVALPQDEAERRIVVEAHRRLCEAR